MRPNWEDAPEWAQFAAMDIDRNWFWAEYMPAALDIHGIHWVPCQGRVEYMADTHNLRIRPT
jgi:hypothetical protein